jgi:hypothetical protein
MIRITFLSANLAGGFVSFFLPTLVLTFASPDLFDVLLIPSRGIIRSRRRVHTISTVNRSSARSAQIEIGFVRRVLTTTRVGFVSQILAPRCVVRRNSQHMNDNGQVRLLHLHNATWHCAEYWHSPRWLRSARFSIRVGLVSRPWLGDRIDLAPDNGQRTTDNGQTGIIPLSYIIYTSYQFSVSFPHFLKAAIGTIVRIGKRGATGKKDQISPRAALFGEISRTPVVGWVKRSCGL